MLKEQIFNTGVVSINYAEGPPSGPPLLLLHGFTSRWQNLLPIMSALSMRWHIYAPDFRGHGRSGRIPGHYGREDYLADIMAFTQRKLTEPAIVFGHSMGGLYAAWLAAQVPEKVRAVIIGDAPLSIESIVALESDPARMSFWAAVRELARSGHSVRELVPLLAEIPVPGLDPPVRYGDLPEVDAAGLRQWAKTLGQLDPGVLEFHAEGRIREMLEDLDMDHWLRLISCPLLLLQGNPSLGGLMTDRDVEHALSVFPEAYHVRIEDAGHDLGLSIWQVGPLLTALTDFLESL